MLSDSIHEAIEVILEGLQEHKCSSCHREAILACLLQLYSLQCNLDNPTGQGRSLEECLEVKKQQWGLL